MAKPIAVIADTEQALVLSCRALRACKQYGNKRRSELASLRDRKKRGSANRKRIQKRMNRFKAQQERRERDILHKVSRAVVDHAVARRAGKIVIGDVRDVADGVNLGHRTNQQVSGWSHGRLRQYITYKAELSGSRSCCRMSTTRPRHAPCVGKGKSPADASIDPRLAVACSTGTLSAQSTSCLRTSTANLVISLHLLQCIAGRFFVKRCVVGRHPDLARAPH